MGAAVSAVVIAAVVTGALAPIELDDPGAFVRWGQPVLTAIAIVTGCATLGLLAFAAFLTPERTHTTRRVDASRIAAFMAMLWAVTSGLSVLFTFADLAGVRLTSPNYVPQFFAFYWSLEVTRVLILVTILAAVVSVGSLMATQRATMAWMALFALVGLVLPALTGHAAGSASHEDAVNALGVHLLGVSCWVGGLLALLVMRPRLGRDLGVTVRRYSVIAGWAYALVVLSGIQQTVIRIGSLDGFATAYGAIVLVKMATLVALGVLGYRQRRTIADRLTGHPGDGRAFARLAAVELGLMGMAIGLSAVLARTIPPIPDAAPNPSLILSLTGFPDPGPMTPWSWATAWRIEWLFLGIAVVAVGLYLAGVHRLHQRGDRWPLGRTICWVVGWLLWVYSTCGAPDIWGRVLMSTHMLMHMLVAMIVPLFLVPGASITLALRALRARPDKTWGPRELLLHAVHSRALVWLANPIVAAALFFFSLAVFYYTGLFDLALRTHTGHLLMMAHFLLTGFLFVWVLIGTDPGPPKWSPLMLLVILFVTISFHAFFGVIITGSTELLAPDFFGTLNLPWGPNPLEDQHRAGEIAWGIGEAPTLVLAVLVAVNWVKSDAKEMVRKDRQADRDHDAELNAYNVYLEQLRRRDGAPDR